MSKGDSPITRCFEIQQRIIKMDMQELCDALNSLSSSGANTAYCNHIIDKTERMLVYEIRRRVREGK